MLRRFFQTTHLCRILHTIVWPTTKPLFYTEYPVRSGHARYSTTSADLISTAAEFIGEHRQRLVNFVTENSFDLRDFQADNHRCNTIGHMPQPSPDLDRRVCDLTLKFIERSNLAPSKWGANSKHADTLARTFHQRFQLSCS